MKDKLTALGIFTFLLFTVSTARFALDSPETVPSGVHNADPSPESATAGAGSNILLPKSDSDETTAENRSPEPEKTTNHLTSRTDLYRFNTDLARFHTINRHFIGKRDPNQIANHRRPYKESATPYKTEKSNEDDGVPYGKTGGAYKTEKSNENDGVPYGKTGGAFKTGKPVVFSRKTGGFYKTGIPVVSQPKTAGSDPETFRVQIPSNWLTVKDHYGSRRHHHHGRDDILTAKRVFDKEKVKSLIRRHKQKKREEETGWMRSIRKFLKHTFD